MDNEISLYHDKVAEVLSQVDTGASCLIAGVGKSHLLKILMKNWEDFILKKMYSSCNGP